MPGFQVSWRFRTQLPPISHNICPKYLTSGKRKKNTVNRAAWIYFSYRVTEGRSWFHFRSNAKQKDPTNFASTAFPLMHSIQPARLWVMTHPSAPAPCVKRCWIKAQHLHLHNKEAHGLHLSFSCLHWRGWVGRESCSHLWWILNADSFINKFLILRTRHF